MAVQILIDKKSEYGCMFDNTTMSAFGPVIYDENADEVLREFINWLPSDPRDYSDSDLHTKYLDFIIERGENI